MSEGKAGRIARHFKEQLRHLDYLSCRQVLRDLGAWAVTSRRVVRLTARERATFKRWLFWKQGGAHCAYCGRVMPLDYLTIDHIQPLSKGGAVRDVRNMALACLGCNREKGNAWEDWVYTTQGAEYPGVV